MIARERSTSCQRFQYKVWPGGFHLLAKILRKLVSASLGLFHCRSLRVHLRVHCVLLQNRSFGGFTRLRRHVGWQLANFRHGVRGWRLGTRGGLVGTVASQKGCNEHCR